MGSNPNIRLQNKIVPRKASKGKTTMQTITRVINPKVNRIYRGTERRDTVKYKGKLLKGYVNLSSRMASRLPPPVSSTRKRGDLKKLRAIIGTGCAERIA
jgi:hypothetical protein